MGSGASVIVSSQVIVNILFLLLLIIIIIIIIKSSLDGDCPKDRSACAGKSGHAGNPKSGAFHHHYSINSSSEVIWAKPKISDV